MLMLLLLAGCSLFADTQPCSDGESVGVTTGFDDGKAGCEYDDDVPDLLLLNYSDAYAASSFASCFKEGYRSGYSDGEAEQDGTPSGDCD